jgi:SagB-type dehydrogenase family enzyme
MNTVIARSPTLLLRRGDGIVLRLTDVDAIAERDNILILYLSGESSRVGRLWNLLDVPRTFVELSTTVGGSPQDALLERMLDAGVLVVCSLATRLGQLHCETTSNTQRSGSDSRWEDARLIRDYAGEGVLELPVPILKGNLADALINRRTQQQLSGAPVSLVTVSTLLAFGTGTPTGCGLPLIVGGPPGRRTYPSGGALYPVEILIDPICVEGLAPGYYRYQVLGHRLVPVSPPQGGAALAQMLVDNRISGAGIVFLLWVDFTRPSLGKYGEKSYRLALLEAGHLAQNLLLVAAALGLGTVPVCGFDDDGLAREAGLNYPQQAILYTVSAGTLRDLASPNP